METTLIFGVITSEQFIVKLRRFCSIGVKVYSSFFFGTVFILVLIYYNSKRSFHRIEATQVVKTVGITVLGKYICYLPTWGRTRAVLKTYGGKSPVYFSPSLISQIGKSILKRIFPTMGHF